MRLSIPHKNLYSMGFFSSLMNYVRALRLGYDFVVFEIVAEGSLVAQVMVVIISEPRNLNHI